MEIVTLNTHVLSILKTHGLTTLDQAIAFLFVANAYHANQIVSLNELQQIVNLPKSSFFRMIKKMEHEMGLFQTVTNFDDLRNKNVELTSESVLVLEELHCEQHSLQKTA